ncbi:MAG: rhomboid family intramembrane serine protease [Trueperaceae bacterium]|nr:MAG: rhomboid family intramembrane serine protease [Trueperaceae bacterium]
MFPLKDANPRHGPAVVMWLVVVANIVVFLIQFSPSDDLQVIAFFQRYGFIPREFFVAPLPESSTLLTSMFLHGGPGHLVGNMFFLFVFGDNVEDRMGHLNFAVFYLLGGVVATLIHGSFAATSGIPMVGASGAISAVLGAYIVLFPRQRVLTLIPPLILPWLALRMLLRVPRFFLLWLPAWLFIGYWALLQFWEATSSVFVTQSDVSGVAWWAHVGGFVFGLLTVSFFTRRKRPSGV